MYLINYALNRDLILQVVNNFEDAIASAVDAVLRALEGDLKWNESCEQS